MQPRQFGTNLNQTKFFFVPFDPIGYTYWDYMDACTKVLWHQNNKFKHSWLIYFKTNKIYNFPNWFLQWWDFFGPIPEIFPEQVQQGYAQFNKFHNSQESRISVNLKYFLLLLYPRFSPGNTGTVKLKVTRISHHFNDMLLSSGGHNLMYPKLNQNKSNFGSKLIRSY